MALGATRAEMVRMVLRETLTLVGMGATLGIVAAMLTTQLLQKLLFGITPTDPVTIGATTLLMFTVAALAGALPARHAAGVDPLVALRCE
jgi:ABC-type antimicrobial peptide transport system permease subunit